MLIEMLKYNNLDAVKYIHDLRRETQKKMYTLIMYAVHLGICMDEKCNKEVVEKLQTNNAKE